MASSAPPPPPGPGPAPWIAVPRSAARRLDVRVLDPAKAVRLDGQETLAPTLYAGNRLLVRGLATRSAEGPIGALSRHVPFVEPRSRTVTPSASMRSSAWIRERLGSSRQTSASSDLPTVRTPGCRSMERPQSGPPITASETAVRPEIESRIWLS